MKLREGIETLTLEEKMEEFMFMGLRMKKGIDTDEFKNRFNVSIESVYGDEIKSLLENELIEKEGMSMKLTDKGTDVSNFVFEKFMLS